MTTVPLTGADMALYRPMMAMDEAGPPPREDLSKAAWGSGDDDPDDFNPAAPDTEEQVRALLEGKLDPADLDALCNLIFPDDTDTAPTTMPAQDKRGRRMGRDQRLVMSSKAEILRRIAVSGEVRAARAVKSHEALVARFPALKNARVA
jgi:hypothetical protein